MKPDETYQQYLKRVSSPETRKINLDYPEPTLEEVEKNHLANYQAAMERNHGR